jgi:hypothetical protein
VCVGGRQVCRGGACCITPSFAYIEGCISRARCSFIESRPYHYLVTSAGAAQKINPYLRKTPKKQKTKKRAKAILALWLPGGLERRREQRAHADGGGRGGGGRRRRGRRAAVAPCGTRRCAVPTRTSLSHRRHSTPNWHWPQRRVSSPQQGSQVSRIPFC